MQQAGFSGDDNREVWGHILQSLRRLACSYDDFLKFWSTGASILTGLITISRRFPPLA
jgi:hypothetical protein